VTELERLRRAFAVVLMTQTDALTVGNPAYLPNELREAVDVMGGRPAITALLQEMGLS